MHWISYVWRWAWGKLADATPSTTEPGEPGEAEELYSAEGAPARLVPIWVLTVYWTDNTLTQQAYSDREAMHAAVEFYAANGHHSNEDVRMSGFAIIDTFKLTVGEDARAKLHISTGTNAIN